MIGVKQTIMKPPSGNCLAACVASILELGIDEVPNFILHGEGWLDALNRFLFTRGLYANYEAFRYNQKGYWIACVADRHDGQRRHCLVMLDQDVAWDPSPVSHLDQWHSTLAMITFGVLDPTEVAAEPLLRARLREFYRNRRQEAQAVKKINKEAARER